MAVREGIFDIPYMPCVLWYVVNFEFRWVGKAVKEGGRYDDADLEILLL